jgi:chromate transporter
MTTSGPFRQHWRNIATTFLKLGVTSDGGPAIMGIMQTELQEKRQWVSRDRFLEGLPLVNMLPGATATQLGIFLGYARGGWWGAARGSVLRATGVLRHPRTHHRVRGVGLVPVVRGALYGFFGVLAVSLVRLAPYALPDLFAVVILAASLIALTLYRVGTFKIMLAGSILGALRTHFRVARTFTALRS